MNQQWSYYGRRIVTCTVSLAVMMLIIACSVPVAPTSPTVAPTINTTVTPTLNATVTPAIVATVAIISAHGIENGGEVALVAPGDGLDRQDYIIAEQAGSPNPQTLIIFVTATAKFDQVKQLSAGMTVQITAEVHPADTPEATSSTAEAIKNNPGAINDELEASQISPPNSSDPNGGIVTYQGKTTQDVSADNMLHFNVGPNLSYDFAIDPKILSTAQSIKRDSFVRVSVEFKNSQGERCSHSATGCTGTVESVESVG